MPEEDKPPSKSGANSKKRTAAEAALDDEKAEEPHDPLHLGQAEQLETVLERFRGFFSRLVSQHEDVGPSVETLVQRIQRNHDQEAGPAPMQQVVEEETGQEETKVGTSD